MALLVGLLLARSGSPGSGPPATSRGVAAGSSQQGSAPSVSYAGDFRVGGTIERLSLPDLMGDGVVEYEAFRDRPLVLNFFASWCPFCVAEMPAFQKVHEQMGSRVAFLGVSNTDPRSASIDLVRQAGVTYPTAADPEGKFFHAVGTAGMPTTLFVRPGGRIAFVQVGPLDEASLKEAISRYLQVPV